MSWLESDRVSCLSLVDTARCRGTPVEKYTMDTTNSTGTCLYILHERVHNAPDVDSTRSPGVGKCSIGHHLSSAVKNFCGAAFHRHLQVQWLSLASSFHSFFDS